MCFRLSAYINLFSHLYPPDSTTHLMMPAIIILAANLKFLSSLSRRDATLSSKIMPLAILLLMTYYSKNYASTIGTSLTHNYD